MEPKSLSPDTFAIRSNMPKCVCGWGSAPDPAWGAQRFPRDP